jgi:DNA segregation ATPase FtsK/SpoIIIE and related proteins
LQSFGLISFLILFTLISWGLKLIFDKELKNIIFKLLFLILYLIFGCTFLHTTFNNSFWLIDNGNSGFVGKLIFNFINQYIPAIESEYTSFALVSLTILFFFLSSDINIKKLFSSFFTFFLKKKNENIENTDDGLISDNQINEVKNEKQQSFLFAKEQTNSFEKSKKFQLPSIDLLEKNNSKLSPQELNKNRPDGQFMEGILQDFGINGQIKKINNGPVVSLYEFEPAAGVKVSKIVNLSDDLARNTSSTSARVAVIPGKIL